MVFLTISKADVCPSVNTYKLDSQLRHIWYGGPDNAYVFAMSNSGTLYRSTNEGKDWTNEFKAHPDQWKAAQNATLPYGQKGITSAFVSPVDPNFIVFTGGTRIWVTQTGGDHYKYIDYSAQGVVIPFEDAIYMHPADNGAFALIDQAHGLYVSTNYGDTLDLVSYNITHRANRKSFMWTNENEYRLGMLYMKKDRYTASLMHRTSPTNSNSESVVLENCREFAYNHNTLWLMEPDEVDNELRMNIYVTNDFGKELNNTRFPYKINGWNYQFLDTSDGYAVISAQDSRHSSSADLYTAKYQAGKFDFARSLDRVVVWEGSVDFFRLDDLEGVFFANTFVDTESTEETEGEHSNPTKKRTLMSHNAGGSWETIDPPAINDCVIGDACFLNLRGVSKKETVGRFHTAPNTVGMIIATGNTGAYKRTDYDDKVFISTDAGWTWKEVALGEYSYEFGDSGGVVVLSPRGVATKTIKYSWDYNYWYSCSISDDKLDVYNVISEPGYKSTSFIAYGVSTLIHLDFAELHQRTCSGIQNAGENNSDYEIWSPHDAPTGEKCFFGEKMTYTRRKPTSACFNGASHQVISSSTTCDCSDHDLECDECYYHDISQEFKTGGIKCIFDKHNCESESSRGSCSGGDAFVATGYRLNPLTKCQASSDFLSKLPHETSCGGSGNKGLIAALVMVFLGIVIVGAGGAFAWHQYKNNIEFQLWIQSKFVSSDSSGPMYSVLGGSNPESVLDDDYGDDATVLDDEDISNRFSENPEMDNDIDDIEMNRMEDSQRGGGGEGEGEETQFNSETF